jgi:hypothetical protein
MPSLEVLGKRVDNSSMERDLEESVSKFLNTVLRFRNVGLVFGN